MHRPPLILGGVQFDLVHLAPTQMLCPRIGADGPDLVIDVGFSHHTYTVAAPGIPARAGAPHVTERGDVRLFDLVRWQQSRDHLPGMVASLPAARVEFTPEKRNYRYALKGRLADGQEYALFFSLRRSSVAGHDLRMTVEGSRHRTGSWPVLVIMPPSPHGMGEPNLLLVAGPGCGSARNLGH